MSRLISELLQAQEPGFSVDIAHLERASGMHSTDVHLASDIIAKAHARMRALGLDPSDSTGEEIYRSLVTLLRKHDDYLFSQVGGRPDDDIDSLLTKILHFVEHLKVPKKVWAIKHSVAKKLLKAHAPKHTMKILGYRSIDSIIKREPIGQLFALVRSIESATWNEQLLREYQALQPTDFETREVELFVIVGEKWKTVAEQYLWKNNHNIAHSKELGSIVLLPLPLSNKSGLTTNILLTLFHYINELHIYSSYFRLLQARDHFGKHFVTVLKHDISSILLIGDQQIDWRVVHRHYSSRDSSDHPEMFEPYVMAEDFVWKQAVDTLYRLEPALHFWLDTDYVGVIKDNQVVSFNIMDVAIALINDLPYGKQTAHHMQRGLIHELHARYLLHQPLENQLLKNLDTQMHDQIEYSEANIR